MTLLTHPPLAGYIDVKKRQRKRRRHKNRRAARIATYAHEVKVLRAIQKGDPPPEFVPQYKLRQERRKRRRHKQKLAIEAFRKREKERQAELEAIRARKAKVGRRGSCTVCV